MQEIVVDLGPRSYPVLVGAGALAHLSGLARSRRLVVVSNARVWGLHGTALSAGLGLRLEPLLVPDGERAKNRSTLAGLHDALLERGIGRDGLVVAFGGGVVTDLAGFAAATWMRGTGWVAVPTTLLAMADAAVGGKVGINHPKGKNLIGAFHQPRAVVADTAVLATLPPRQLRSGAYEVLKCALIADRPLLGPLREAGRPERWDAAVRERAVLSACRVKARVVSADEQEGGPRRVLNLGHTVGHALEAVTGYRRLTHGEAVGWGLVAAARLAVRRDRLSAADAESIEAAVDALGPRPPVRGLEVDAVMAALARDKKARDGRVPFVLPVPGGVEVDEDVTVEDVRAVVSRLLA